MRRIVFISFGFLMFATTAFGHPPSEMTLHYNLAKKTLQVDMIHVVPTNRNQHYIKEIRVSKNNEEPVVFNYRGPQGPREVSETISFNAAPGDTLYVKAFCSKGGTKEETFVLPNVAKKKEK